MAMPEALVEALLEAKNLCLLHIIVLTDSRCLEQVCNNGRKPHWKEQTMLTVLHHFSQQGMKFSMLLVPKVILSNVLEMASLATKMPIHQHWVHPESCTA